MTWRYRHKVTVTRWALIIGAVFILEAAPRLGWIDPLTLVPVSTMLRRLVQLLLAGKLNTHIISTGGNIIASFVLAVALGIPFGLVLWRFPRFKRVVDPYLTTYYAIPIFALYPLLISLLGMGYLPVIAIAWAWSVVAVMVNTAVGFQQVPKVYTKVARSLRLSRWYAFSRVLFPAAAPQIFTGLKLAVTYSVIGVIASEFILAPQGLGWLVAYNYNNFGLADMYSAILLILLLGVLINGLVDKVESRIWRRRAG